MKRLGLAVAACWLVACTTAPPAPPAAMGLTATGRMNLRIDATPDKPSQSLTAGFEWRGTGERGSLTLLSPLGTQVAQATWAPGEAVLTSSEGSARFANLDELAERALGERLPLAAWPDWLAGRPWPGASSRPWAAAAASGGANVSPGSAPSAGAGEAAVAEGRGFEQLGWQVDTSRLAEGRLLARRPALPVVAVRIVLDAESRSRP